MKIKLENKKRIYTSIIIVISIVLILCIVFGIQNHKRKQISHIETEVSEYGENNVTNELIFELSSENIVGEEVPENEIENVINVLDQKGKDLNKLQKRLLKSNSQSQDIVNYLTPIIENVVKKREKIDDNSNAELHNQINDIIMNGELAYGM